MRIRFNIVLLSALVLSIIQNTTAQPISLKWIGEKPAQTTAVSWGVPFEKGKIKNNQSFQLTDEKKQTIDHQTWPMAYWPDGSVKWLGFAATVQPSEKYYLQTTKAENTVSKISVINLPEGIKISNGQLSCEINKKGNHIIKYLKINNKTISENARLVCTLENRENIDAGILKYENYQSEIKNVELEQSGPIRAVVKITGVHKSTSNQREILTFVVRLYVYAGVNNIRMIHSFVYNANQETDFVKGLGVIFDVPLREQPHNRHIRFSGENGGLWSESVKPLSGRYPFSYNGLNNLSEQQHAGLPLPEINNSDSISYIHYQNFATWNNYKLTQLNPNGFSILKQTNSKSSWLHSDDGKRSAGLALLGDISGGIAVSVKDFWQSYPASLEINNATTDQAQLKVWLWSPDGEAMDLRHYDTVAHNLLSTYEDYQPGLSTAYGIARTSELNIFAFDQLPSKDQTIAMVKSGENPHQLICTPEYLHQVKAFGTWSLPDKSNATKQWIENQLDSSILFYKKAIDERHWYGFWNYGDVMHSYDANRHSWKYDVGGFAWANTELAPGNWLWYSFLRTGRADIYKMAMAMSRHTAEVDAYHIGEMKGLGTRHNVSHWGCGAKEARIGQAAWKRFQYYLTTDERSGDLMREALDVEKALIKYEPLRIAQPRHKFPYNAPTRLRWGPDWLALAGNWLTEWERTGNTMYRDKIITGLDGLAKLPDNLFTGSGGLCYDPKNGKIWYDGKKGLTNENHLSTIMGGYEILLELFELIDHPAFEKKFTEYCKLYSMPKNDPERNSKNKNQGDIGFKTPRLTAFAAHKLNDDRIANRAWNEFLDNKRLKNSENTMRQSRYNSKIINSSDVLNPVNENPYVGTNGTSQWGLNAIIMLELIGDKIPDFETEKTKNTIKQIQELNWKTVFSDDFKKSWQENWFLDGLKANLIPSKNGLIFKAGPTEASDADHSVLWTKKTFSNDIRIDFDFVKMDSSTKYVNIIYLFAEGSGKQPYDTDISKWANLRSIPAMKNYYEHMNALHISFAAFDNNNHIISEDYVRARQYLPERAMGLDNTDFKPDYFRTGLFNYGDIHHITIIRKSNMLYMIVKNSRKEKIFYWNSTQFPYLKSGRIGLRLMGSRVSEFSNFKVSCL